MEGGDNILRVSSSNIWRNSGREVFSTSFHDEDDEDALKWAALEKLPTYRRIRKGILTEEQGHAREIDIKNLGVMERKNLLERLVKIAEDDNEKFLLKLKKRIDRVGIDLPTIEVRFEHLNVDAEAYVGGRALPTILNFSINFFEGFLNYLHVLPSRKKPLSILHDVSGIIKPGRMTLLLGPPSSGKTSLLLALGGKLDSDLKVSGKVTYNGHGMNEFVPQRTSAYISQHDLHIGELTVRETLAFSARCQGVGARYDMLAELARREKEANIKPDPDLDIYMKAVSLEGQMASVATDYVLKVTSKKDQEQYWAKRDVPYNFVTVNEFAKAFLSFHIGQKLRDELAVPFDKAKSHPAALTTKKYGISKKELLKALASREYLLMKRNSFVYIFKFTQLIIIALIAMTVFLRTEMPKKTTADGTVFMGALFYSIMMIMFNGYAELAMTILKLPTFYKQRDLLFFPAWAYSLPTWILKIPITFVEVVIWVFITYYVIGFDPNVGRLFKMYLLLLFINQMASGMFRLIGALGRNMIVANTFGSFALLGVLVLGGFILSRENIKKWWIWGYWASPLMYAQNAIAVNEFLGSSWKHVPVNLTESLGVIVLKSRGLFPEAYWYWIGVGASIGYIFLFNSLFTLALAYLNPFEKPQAILTEETMAERNACKTREIELSSKEKRLSERGDEIQRSASSTSVTSRAGSVSEVSQSKKRGMILPFEPLSITFDDVRYAVDMPQEMKAQGIPEDRLELLKGVSGAFRPGVLTTLMGVSGAGKTTLMDVLAGRKTGGYIEGSITISGYPKKQETFARIAGYCEQTDIHSPHVTVYESLQYSAWLRLSPDVDSASKKMFVDEVMELVELTPLKEALVGLPGVNGLSTEQRKRLTIAVELIANPSIIFMDEPTSGLDASGSNCDENG
ncbi:Pleiotropic drug resistance protein 1 [Camellia lanceoleosa]|uniref:Pleiotropic drug resistance protein 1 n=1 Tax=Camellia lanceoleosa TaxID=1840588 RepID=A0ACC0FGV5_9ERIC|nr:Pleiotropic drug resistance protein 1 [Camellia lanceoleosa]